MEISKKNILAFKVRGAIKLGGLSAPDIKDDERKYKLKNISSFGMFTNNQQTLKVNDNRRIRNPLANGGL